MIKQIKMKDKDYKKEYKELKKRFDKLVKHRIFHDVKRCKYCKEWYKSTIEQTKKIKNKQVRESLLETWETLWLNNCGDFDIIAHTFFVRK